MKSGNCSVRLLKVPCFAQALFYALQNLNIYRCRHRYPSLQSDLCNRQCICGQHCLVQRTTVSVNIACYGQRCAILGKAFVVDRRNKIGRICRDGAAEVQGLHRLVRKIRLACGRDGKLAGFCCLQLLRCCTGCRRSRCREDHAVVCDQIVAVIGTILLSLIILHYLLSCTSCIRSDSPRTGNNFQYLAVFGHSNRRKDGSAARSNQSCQRVDDLRIGRHGSDRVGASAECGVKIFQRASTLVSIAAPPYALVMR